MGLHALHWYLDDEALATLHARVGLRPAVVLPALAELRTAPVRCWVAPIQDGVVPLSTYWAFHFGIVGAVINSVFLLALGARLECRAGSARFGGFVGVCVIAGACAHLWLRPTDVSPALGGSALTAGVLGAYLVWYWRSKVTVFVPVIFVPAFVAVGAPILAIGWAAVQFEPVQRLLTRGDGHPLAYGAVACGAAAGVVGSVLLWPRRGSGKARR